MSRHACPECGIDYDDGDMQDHLLLEHGIEPEDEKFEERAEEQAQAEMMEMDRMTAYKAQQYDRIAEMFFMSCGVIEDGNSLRYIIDPETVAEELMKIVTEDINIDRDLFIQRKTDYFNGRRIKAW